jgi:hypothetical protein
VVNVIVFFYHPSIWFAVFFRAQRFSAIRAIGTLLKKGVIQPMRAGKFLPIIRMTVFKISYITPLIQKNILNVFLLSLMIAS